MASVKVRLEEIITCGICLELFNKDFRCPRMLLCGHTFCHSCLDRILKQSPSCPTCKTGIHNETTELIPLNFTVKSMISVVKSVNENESQNYPIPILTQSSSTEKLESEGYCSDHSYFKKLRCMDCESWICAMCAALHHKNCRTLLVKEAYKALKNQVSDKVKVELEAVNSLSLVITESLKILNQEREVLIDEIKTKEKELKDKENNIEKHETQKSEKNNFCEKLINLESLIGNSVDDSEFSKLINEMNDLLDRGKTLIAQFKDLETTYPMAIKIKSLQPLYVKQSVLVVENGVEPLYGMVRVKDDCIWISSFQTEKPEARLLPFRESMSNFSASSRLPKRAFLLLTPEGSSNEQIEVVIETADDSARGKNFILLCSALKGRTYKGKTLTSPRSTIYRLLTGPIPVVKGIKDDDSRVLCKEGFVSGMEEGNSYFNVSLEDDFEYNQCKIGFIVSGLQKLREFRWQRLTISDCGLIF